MRIILLFLSVCYSAVIKVPADYTTIQEGIDAASEGDIVVVYPDTYYENITVDKTITLTSLALFDTTTNTLKYALDTWFSDDYPIVVTDDYINTTIIDGSTSNTRSPVIIDGNGGCIIPTVQGFTIQGGNGTEVDRYYEDPEGGTVAVKQHLGGGIFTYKSNPKIYYNKIQNNGLESDVETGGAIYASSDTEDCDWSTRRSKVDEECDNDSFDFKHNFFENNDSRLGMHLSNRKFDGEFNLSGSVFDYWNCQNPEYQTKCWINIDEIEDLTAEVYKSNSCLRSEDTYVDPDLGDDEFNDGSIDSPFLTIGKAIISVAGSELAPVTIHLAEGTYSPSTNGEIFPIEMISYVNLIGEGQDVTILDAEASEAIHRRVITIEEAFGVTLANATFQNGVGRTYSSGIYILNSNVNIENVKIRDNEVGGIRGFGGGIFCQYSTINISNSTIQDNSALKTGGGICLSSSISKLINVNVIRNQARTGGGVNIDLSDVAIVGGNIKDNKAFIHGGGICITSSNPTIDNVFISGNIASPLASPVPVGPFDINEGIGGGMSLYSSSPIIRNTTITNNNVDLGCAIRCYNNSYPQIVNSILWNNSPTEIEIVDSSYTDTINSAINISYSDIQGGEDGIINNGNSIVNWLDNNIDADPLFADPENGDFTLMQNSPCIDAGTSYIEIEGEPFDDLNGNGIWDEGEEFTDFNQNGIYDTSEIPEDDYCGTAPDMGAFEYIAEDCEELSAASETPLSYQIQAAYPNPFNPVTNINYILPNNGNVKLNVYNIQGREIETLMNTFQTPGYHSISWNASSYPSGVYLIRMDSGDFTRTQKVVLVK